MFQTEKKRKYINRAYIFLCVFVVTAMLFIPHADAAAALSWREFPQAMCDQINKGVFNIVNGTFIDGGDTGIYDSQTTSEAYQYVVGADSDSIGGDDMFRTFMTGLGFIAYAIAVGIALARWYQNVERGADAMEQTFKFIIEIFVVALIMLQLTKIINFIAEAAGAVIANLTPTDVDSKQGLKLEAIGIKGKEDADGKVQVGGLKWLRAMAILIIPWIFSLLLLVAAYFISFSIILELGIRRIFMPFAIADIYGEGIRSPGMRYIKKYIAVFFKIAICLAVGILASKLNGVMLKVTAGTAPDAEQSIGTTIASVIATLALNMTCLAVMKRGGEYANDIVGA